MLLWSTRNVARYAGEDNVERNAGAGMMLVCITEVLSEDVTEE
ncbi:hypothetical protein [Bounagaea algeriensis]